MWWKRVLRKWRRVKRMFCTAIKHIYLERVYLLSFSPAGCAVSPESTGCTREIITVRCELRFRYDEPRSLSAKHWITFDTTHGSDRSIKWKCIHRVGSVQNYYFLPEINETMNYFFFFFFFLNVTSHRSSSLPWNGSATNLPNSDTFHS